jgi:hypothetical protein
VRISGARGVKGLAFDLNLDPESCASKISDEIQNNSSATPYLRRW